THFRPSTGAPSPVLFVGFSCALCHSRQVILPDGNVLPTIYGAGNSAVDLGAFFDAFRGAILDGVDTGAPLVTVGTISDAYRAKFKRGLTLTERGMIQVWLEALRKQFLKSAPKYDDPYDANQLFDPEFLPQGPGRTHPFGTLVAAILDRPPRQDTSNHPNRGFSKIPAVFHQDLREWAQFD